MARRSKLNPDQIPLITPDSDWTIPTELPTLRNVEEIGLDTETKDEGLASGRGPGWAFGAGYIAGVGNGDPSDHDPDKANYRNAFNGKCMVVVGAGENPGAILLRASSPGLKGMSLRFQAR